MKGARTKQSSIKKDPNFKTILKWVRQLQKTEFRGVYAGCPIGYVENPQKVAELVDFIDPHLINNQDLVKVNKDERLKEIVNLVSENKEYWWFDSMGFDDTWISVFLLSCWWGCLAGAKLVAYRTRAGVNTPLYRREKIKEVDERMPRLKRLSLGFELGFKAGPYLRQLRGQGVYFFGIPNTYMKKYGWDEVEKTL